MYSEVTTATALDLARCLDAETKPLVGMLHDRDLETVCEYDTSLIDELLVPARKVLDISGNDGAVQSKKPKTDDRSRIYEFVDSTADIVVDDETVANVSTSGCLSDQIIEAYLW
jgi:hypothetical protein